MSAPVPQPASAPAAPAPSSTPARPTPEARPAARWLLALLGAVALLPAVIAVAQLGRIHPDEVYQVLEPAWHRAHGYGVLAWEWRDGLRNWAVPIVLSWLLRLADLLGLTHPQAYRALIALPQAALHGWMLLAAYRFASRRAGQAGGLLTALLLGLYGPVLVFAGRTMSESFSAAFLVVGLEALDRKERLEKAGLLGGLALGLAVVARYGSAVFVAAALVWLVLARRWRVLAFTCLGGLATALGLGALDQATWGSPFHSFFAYLRFNVLSGGAAQNFGVSPPGFYVPVLLSALPIWLWLTVPHGFDLLRRRLTVSLPLFCAVAYLVAVSATPHKEERFLYPALVLLLLGAAPALAGWLVAASRPAALRWGGAALVLAATVAPAAFYPPQDLRGDQFRAIVAATRDEHATGLLIVNEGLWGSGGFFYIGKQIPWLTCDWPEDPAFQHAMRDPAFNRVVTFEGRALEELQAAGFRVVRRIGRETVLARP